MAKPIAKELLICPMCRSAKLSFSDNTILCQQCGQQFSIRSGNKYLFVTPPKKDQSFLGKSKEGLKKFPRFYRLLIHVISPVCPTDYFKQKKWLNTYLLRNDDAVIINLGSGSSDLSGKISNVDIFPYTNVDMTCDISTLPLKNESVDMVLNIAVLEHVPDPEKVVAEIFRILKPGGTIYCFFPFIQGFHAAPYDFSRKTEAGLQQLFKEFKAIELYNAGGPTSALLWIFEEWLALTLSLGITPLYNLLHLLVMLLLWPLKFFDFLLIKHPKAKNISSGFVFIGKKHQIKRSISSSA